ncbi:MAG: hypothetical protein ACRDP3_26510, partial [Streptomyces sp.]|uniref:DUF7919 family protein n=1 Tax=Streptomyces sp. TaxID=1931 RepID=UPI003D6B69FF
MTWYADLTPYEHLAGSIPESVDALNVGWLEQPHAFPEGEVSEEFVEALGVLCRDHRRAATRGWQSCSFEPGRDPFGGPPRILVGGESVTLGNAEVRVISRHGRWLIAPTLV